ncbi:MAG: c-type cytochrome, partial [Leptospiraceae bacterium]|nr:c-type cytochrome [Leptospiraceae bacterium]
MKKDTSLKEIISILVLLCAFVFCGKKDSNDPDSKEKANPFGVGPIQNKLDLKEVNESLAKQGEEIFKNKCTACHKLEERYVGPALKRVTTRRQPEWIMNMIID